MSPDQMHARILELEHENENLVARLEHFKKRDKLIEKHILELIGKLGFVRK